MDTVPPGEADRQVSPNADRCSQGIARDRTRQDVPIPTFLN